jgi:hypothetical protein
MLIRFFCGQIDPAPAGFFYFILEVAIYKKNPLYIGLLKTAYKEPRYESLNVR